MTIGITLRKTLSGSMLALAMALAVIVVPMGAQAKSGTAPAGVTVCNTANGKGGNLVVDALDKQAPVHVSSNLREKQGGKNINAAEHSRALALCSVPAPVVGGDVDPVEVPGDDNSGSGGNTGSGSDIT